MKHFGRLFLGAACAACCASFFVPVLSVSAIAGLGTASAGWFVGLGLAEIVCLTLAAGMTALAVAWTMSVYARKRAQKVTYKIGEACDPLDRQ